MPPSEATSQYPWPSGVDAIPTTAWFRWMPPVEPERRGAEGEDPAVGGHEPVALAAAVAAMPTIGLLRAMPPVEP